MRRGFYLKMAADNIRKNARSYLPFLFAGFCTVAVTYIMYALTQNSGLSQVMGGKNLQMILLLGSNIMAIFSVIFLFYTNSFLMKRRKKEFGMYNILGMEKKHIAKIIFYETFYIAVLSIGLGLAVGVILNKLFVLLALRLMHTEVVLGFEISWGAMAITAGLFGAIFCLILLNNIRQVHKTNPIDLLKGGNVGEKEPKTKGLIAILGIISLGMGYYIAITTKDPLSALMMFFLAVVLVMIGTYLLFAAGSIAFLKALRKKKSFYYQPKHFISVSGLIYRMKQNAVGLANICILSTGVLLLVSITVSLYAGTEDAINQRYPNDIALECKGYSDESRENLEQLARKIAADQRIGLEQIDSYAMLSFSALPETGGFEVRRPEDVAVSDAMKNINVLYFLTADDFNQMVDGQETLEENQIMIIGPRGRTYDEPQLEIFDYHFQVKKNLSKRQTELLVGPSAAVVYESYFIIVKDMSVLTELEEKETAVYGAYASEIRMHCDINTVDETDEEAERLYKEQLVKEAQAAGISIEYTEARVEGAASVWGLYSGFLFLGILLATLFLMATVLIIYYKQISEGYEDKDRYEIMQKVGMSHREVKQLIQSQILMVFFLPLVTAGIHLIAAFPMVKRMLALLMLTNERLFVGCTVVSFVVFALVYAAIYRVTARSYYKIVSAAK